MTEGGIELIRETASQITSALCGLIPVTVANSYGLVFKEPLGVVLGIAPWNAPVILGLRAVIGPIAAGNTAVLKVRFCPMSHESLRVVLIQGRDRNSVQELTIF
jgi:acyl-CoA reductase-like NAD-dependent aldehyde dehydrogenase